MAQAKNPQALPGKGGTISKWITPQEQAGYNQQEAAAGLPKNYLGVAARIESQDDGDWNSKTGSNVGRFQFNQGDIDTWLGSGHSVDNKDDQAAAMVAEAKSYGPRIQAITGQPATISQLYLAHQQREGFMKMLQDPSAPAVQSVGDPANITGNQGNLGQTGADFMSMWDRKAGDGSQSTVQQTLQEMAHRELVTHVAGIYNNRTQQLWDGIKSAWDKNQQPSSQELDDLNTLMPTVSDNKLRQDVATRLPQEAAKGTLAQFPTQTQSNIVSAGQIAATHGDLGYVDREVLARTQQSLQEKQKLLASDPVTYGQKFLPPQAAPDVRDIQPLDLSSPQNFATTLGPRLKVAAVVRQIEPSAISNPLTADDRTAVAGALKTLPGAQAGGILGQLSQSLSQEQLQEVMKDPGIKASVSGMTTSGDLAKVQAAYSFMGNMEKNNPQMGVEQTFGTPAYQSMRVWQDKTSYEPPADALKEMQTYNDPMNTAAINGIRDAAKKELEPITGANVASRLFGGYNPFGPPLDPKADNVEGSSDRMLAEYSAAYRDFRTKGDTAAAATAHATEQVSKNWGPSEANGGRIMRNPPEMKLLPIDGRPQTIDGSYSWVNDQLKDDIVKSLGFGDAPLGQTAPIGSSARAKLDDVQRDIESSPDRANAYKLAVASHYLVPDDKTDADIASGRNPSYHVVIENADGHMQVLTAAPGSSELLRFRPDFKTAADKFNQGPAQFRHAVTQGVVEGLVNGGPLPLQP